jgi:ferredoxin
MKNARVIPIQPQSAEGADGPDMVSLYASQAKVYPRSVSGRFARWRWALVGLTQAVFYGLPWLQWNGRQAVLFDLGARRFYIFGLVLQPQDFIYLAALLVISALALFFFTAVAGRLWCGYACPQTVYTEIFLWIERRVEGDRQARMRLDAAPWSARKLARKAKQACGSPWACGPASASWATSRPSASWWPSSARWPSRPGNGSGCCSTAWPPMATPAYARAGLQVHVPLRALPERDVRQGHADDHLRHAARRAARLALAPADPATLGLGSCIDCTLCVQVCPPASTSATACSTNASAARPASTCATR